ncbi:hypothetical protein [Microbacterium murale]|uniref:Uncharacterized protein n=1 Tax=Microbacterium murale TaxID=1081040 RepID=A0ABU0P8T2_9MICO|nr:hypothetical protein [Microbacterium murale]MDQ0643718.1 hypothetical protein [Microbacterium murale]
MSDVERHGQDSPAPASGEEDYGRLGERRTRRMRIVAWVTIVALILIGGGSTVLSLLFG